ncbi:hypothetical protein [Frondihabitans cladoniiphilus]|uniref:Uncharacterized protein n=1 Tax=Frondihabitans cladoniiphilus TaxID=715785 RepID=A0ABP8W5H8_9MICO
MRIARGADRRREHFSAQELELAAILFDWDPIGLTAMGATHVDDEYDDLVRPVLAELRRGVHHDSLAMELVSTIRRDYGLELRTRDTAAVAVRITDWWRASREEPPHPAWTRAPWQWSNRMRGLSGGGTADEAGAGATD